MVGLGEFYDYCFKHDACKSYSTILTNKRMPHFFSHILKSIFKCLLTLHCNVSWDTLYTRALGRIEERGAMGLIYSSMLGILCILMWYSLYSYVFIKMTNSPCPNILGYRANILLLIILFCFIKKTLA